MNEEDKAQKLSEAIDALLEGREPDLDDQELRELLGVARLRLRAGKALADVGLTYQELLRRVLQARMVSRQMTPDEEADEDPPPEAHDITEIADPKEYLDPLDPGYGKLVNFLDFWPRAGETNPSTGAKGATAATKLAGPPAVIPLWKAAEQHKATKADSLAPVVDRLVRSRKRTCRWTTRSWRNWCRWPISVAMSVRPWPLPAHPTSAGCGPSCACAWPPTCGARPRSRAVLPSPWRRAAPGSTAVAAAAAVALTLFTVGPWAASGFAQNPISQVFDFVGEHVGRRRAWTSRRPHRCRPPLPWNVVSPDRPQQRLGIPVRQPTYLPDGFELASSVYYSTRAARPRSRGCSSTRLRPRRVDPETLRTTTRASSSTKSGPRPAPLQRRTPISRRSSSAARSPATYVRGIWQAGPDGTLEWVEDHAEVLVFDQNGVRTFIVYRYGEQEKDELLKIAESMLAHRPGPGVRRR